jgi:hypothetical protein
MLVHPEVRQEAGGGPVVEVRLAEEHRAKVLLSALDKMGPDAEGFDDLLVKLRDDVEAHAAHEEREEFPLLRKTHAPTRLQAMGGTVRAAEGVAPMRSRVCTPARRTSCLGRRWRSWTVRVTPSARHWASSTCPATRTSKATLARSRIQLSRNRRRETRSNLRPGANVRREPRPPPRRPNPASTCGSTAPTTPLPNRFAMPLRNGKTTPERGDGHRGGTPGPKLGTTERADRNAERFDERRALIALAGRVLGAWGHTVRQLGDGKQSRRTR